MGFRPEKHLDDDDDEAETTDFAATVVALPPSLAPENGVDSLPNAADSSLSGELSDRPTLSHVGRYALKRRLGEGGLGTVYEAWDPLLSRRVAVKTLQFRVETPARVALDRMFLNEARAVAGLNHPHIVTVYDAGLSAQGVYIAMERLRGRDLRQALAGGWRPSPALAALLIRRVADALAYAHARGVVHCDIKPANIFLTRKDRPTVLDFGIARVAHGAASPVLDGMIAGSPHYLAPEQLEGGDIDGRTDVYALGVVLYELLTARKAFDGGSLEQITSAVLHNHPAPAHELRPTVPPALSAVVARAMARDPAERYASAADLAQALRPWHGHAGDDAERAAPPPLWKRRAVWAAVAAGVVSGLVAWAALRQSPIAPPARAAQAAAPPAAAVAATPAPAETVEGAEGAEAPAIDLATGAPTDPQDVAAAPPAVAAAPPPPVKAAKPRPKPAAPKPAAAPAATGSVTLAISPWGSVEVDGRPAGVTPPLARLELPAGRHEITVRNGDFPPFSAVIDVSADQPVALKHRFGS